MFGNKSKIDEDGEKLFREAKRKAYWEERIKLAQEQGKKEAEIDTETEAKKYKQKKEKPEDANFFDNLNPFVK